MRSNSLRSLFCPAGLEGVQGGLPLGVAAGQKAALTRISEKPLDLL